MTLREAMQIAAEKIKDETTTPVVAEVLTVLVEAVKRRRRVVSITTDAETITAAAKRYAKGAGE